MKNSKQVVLFVTHFINNYVVEGFQRMRTELEDKEFDVLMLLNSEETSDIERISALRLPFYLTDINKINSLRYTPILNTLFPGSCHFPVLAFFQEHPEYSHYWFVEYDVCFTGDWALLADDCTDNLSDYDFLSCHIEKFDPKRNGHWPWWHKFNNVGYPLERCVKGFNPICRYSNRTLAYIDQYQKAGHSAHSEVIITTCLHNAGYKIGDIGGTGEFTPAGWRNRYYIQGVGTNNGTMRWRPEFSAEEIAALGTRNRLFHPLKNFYPK